MERGHLDKQRPDLIVSGVITGVINDGADRRVQLVVAIEPVVADDADAELLALIAAEVRADAFGRFTYSCDLADEVRASLAGWVMCTVLVEPSLSPSTSTATKIVRWQRPSSAELIVGLNALLGTIVVEAATNDRTNR